METKLATIVCADVIGYSRIMQQDERGTLERLHQDRARIDPMISKHRGRLFNTGGDSIFVEFASAVDAVKFSIDMQTELKKQENSLRWRVGMHMGEVWISGQNLLGDAVNLAARTESLADYGGVTMTETVYALVRGKITDHEFVSRGQQEFKNVKPMEIFSVVLTGAEPNPFLNRAPKPHTVTETTSNAELVKSIVSDQAARNRSFADAQALKRDGKIGPAVRILMHGVTKRNPDCLDLLITMLLQDQVPREWCPYALAVIEEYCHRVDSDQGIRIADVMIKHRRTSTALKFLKQAALVDAEAQCRYAMMIFSDSSSSDREIQDALGDLIASARRRIVPAMLKLAEYYRVQADVKNEFLWLYAARAQHDVQAQALIENLNRRISKADFQNFRTAGEALVDEIKFAYENRLH